MADDPLDGSPIDWARPPISLIPVDHDPFNDAWAHVSFNDSGTSGSPFDSPPFWMPPFYKPGQSFAPQSKLGDLSAVPGGGAADAVSAASTRNDVIDGGGSPINWAAPSISLVPIDHDPFNDSWTHDPFNNSWATGSPVDPSWMRPFSTAPQGGLGEPSVVPSKAATPPSAGDRSDVTVLGGGVFAGGMERIGDLASQGVSQIQSGLSQLGGAHPPPEPLPPWLDALIQAQPENKAANERTWQKMQGIGDVLGGAFNVAFSPIGMISVPLERAGGTFPNGEPQIPKEVTEFGLGLVGPSMLGGAAKLTRLSKGIKPAIGKLPNEPDIANLIAPGRTVPRMVPPVGNPEPEPPMGGPQSSPARAPPSSIPPQTSQIPRVLLNKAAGDAWETHVTNNVLPEIQVNVRPQITIKSKGPSRKRVRLDAVGQDKVTGEIALSDMKASAKAPFTPQQTVVYPELETYGGDVVGKGKAPYVGGSKIPPTKVKIIRKPGK